jgi:hypothetical protein
MHPLALDKKRVCNTTELRTCWGRTVKAIGVLFHNVVMSEWWSKNKGQRVNTRGGHSECIPGSRH